ncbi:asparaginase [Corynebacterium accolens]|uniref:asparaginase n=1 Tax=Corynebacterium accolens TaxID=38284 RepID=UPI001EDAA4BB|nr:asparaginase [Corynebacterium accolens]MDK4266862.1 asparaginase [Corynebacterium accolens]MDK4308406.1 asparaginase [Corynebacterium accolens]MDK4324157.1 asparaginase [Corynebacterium accolens]
MSNPRLRRRVQYSAALVASALLLASCQNPANQEDKDEASATPTTTSSSTSAEKTSEASSTASSSSSATSSSSASSSATSSSTKSSSSHAKQRSEIEGHVVVLSTGGTIASTHDDKGAVVPTVKGSDLVDPLYSEFDKDKLELEVKDIANLDSSAMTLADTDKIITAVHEQLQRNDVDGVIVTHGTDSMEETAIALDTFHDSDKPVVLTGAMRPFDDDDPDGPENLATAVETVTNPDYAGHGAFIAFDGKVIPARGAFKSDTEKADGFATNSQEKFPERPEPLKYAPLGDVRVDIIAAYPGAPADLIEQSLAKGAQAIVIEGMGSGNIGPDLANAAMEAAKSVPVVLTTRVDHGPVEGIYGGAGGGATLADAGVIPSGNLRAPQARILLAAAVATGTDAQKLFSPAG